MERISEIFNLVAILRTRRVYVGTDCVPSMRLKRLPPSDMLSPNLPSVPRVQQISRIFMHGLGRFEVGYLLCVPQYPCTADSLGVITGVAPIKKTDVQLSQISLNPVRQIQGILLSYQQL